MAKLTIKILLAILVLPSPVFGQEKPERNYSFESDVYNGKAMSMIRPIPYEEIKGSPFHNDSLKLGILLFNAGDTLHRYIRYNAYTDEMEFVSQNSIQSLAEPELLDRVFLNNKVYLYRTFSKNGRDEQGYFILLWNKKCKLYKRDLMEFEPYEPPKNNYDTEKPPRFTPFGPEFYCSCGNSAPVLLSNKSAELKLAFDQKYDLAKKFIKGNKLKMKREEDILLLLGYLDTLEN